MAAPPSDTARIEGLMELIRFGIVMAKRIIPNVPSLRRIPARIIDPATGASTWALGSHKWRKNIGAFAKNAINSEIDHQKLIDGDNWVEIIENSWDWIGVIKMFNRRGKDAVMV